MTENVQRIVLFGLADAMGPLAAAADDPEALRELFEDLGWDTSALNGFPSPELSAAIQACADAVEALAAFVEEVPQSFEELLLAADKAAALIEAIQQLPPVLAGGGITPEDAASLPRDLLALLVIRYLQVVWPTTFHVAQLLGILNADGDSPPSTPGRLPDSPPLPKLELDRIPELLRQPIETLRALYSDGDTGGDRAEALAALIFPLLESLFRSLGVQAVVGLDPSQNLNLSEGARQAARRLLTAYMPIDPGRAGCSLVLSSSADGMQLLLTPFGDLAMTLVRGDWEATSTAVVTAPGIVLGPGGVVLPAGHEEGRIELRLEIVRTASADTVIVGTATSTRLQISDVKITAYGRFSKDVFDSGMSLELSDATFVLAAGDGDGFLQQVLPPEGLRVNFDLAPGWSNRMGFYFRGSAGLEATLPVHLALLGILNVDSMHLALRAEGTDVRVMVATTANAKLGPVAADIDRVGLLAKFTFPPDGGNLGPANMELDFKPPSGVGLSIDAGAVTGGGFLFFDPEEEQYAGAVHLEIEGGISLNAIGLLTTRLPDGSKGFSLLVIVTASGFTPIQLGFGFALTGIGGLLGINRTVAVDVLRAGVRSRALEPVLFSREDPIPRAPEIISTLRSVFPPVRDRYVFGPMAIIGWGTPTVLTIEVAVLLELLAPLRLIVLGRLRALLPGPDERAALVKLNMDVLGVVDFDRREVSIDATLYDSYVSAFAISGDMALRASWGERPGFALAVGGFHPRFQPPPEFPALRRLSISLSTSNNPRLRLEAYLALTSNTVQLGARLDLYVEALGFNLAGMLSFDALAQFAPFGLDLEVAGMLALRRGTSTLMGLAIRMRLTGPAPWHARGEATFQILFIKITIGFDARFGEERLQPAPAPVEIWPHLQEALCDARNWGAELPGEGSALATVRAVDPPPNEVLVHPHGEVSVRQRVVPLQRDISRFANAPPADYRRFRIASVSVGENTLTPQTTYEHFAPAQFEEMPDDRKLASPGFEPMPAGARASGVAPKAGPDRAVTLGYETIVVEPPGEPPAQPLPETYTPAAETLELLAETGAAATAELRRSGRAKFATDGAAVVTVSDPEFALVTREGLVPPEDLPPGFTPPDGSFTDAREALLRLVAERPHHRGNLQVVRKEEALV